MFNLHTEDQWSNIKVSLKNYYVAAYNAHKEHVQSVNFQLSLPENEHYNLDDEELLSPCGFFDTFKYRQYIISCIRNGVSFRGLFSEYSDLDNYLASFEINVALLNDAKKIEMNKVLQILINVFAIQSQFENIIRTANTEVSKPTESLHILLTAYKQVSTYADYALKENNRSAVSSVIRSLLIYRGAQLDLVTKSNWSVRHRLKQIDPELDTSLTDCDKYEQSESAGNQEIINSYILRQKKPFIMDGKSLRNLPISIIYANIVPFLGVRKVVNYTRPFLLKYGKQDIRPVHISQVQQETDDVMITVPVLPNSIDKPSTEYSNELVKLKLDQ